MLVVPIGHEGHTLRALDLPGPGAPLLFLHGLGCASSCDFPAVACDPALAGRRRLLVDLLGFGYSDKPEDLPYTVEAHASDVVALVERLGLPRVDLFGHSMGGAVAIVAASRLGDRVRALICSEPNLDAGGGVFSRGVAVVPEGEYVRAGHRRTIAEAAAGGNLVWSGTMAVASPVAVHRAACSLVRGGTPGWRATLEGLALPRTVLIGERSLPSDDVERLRAAGVGVAIVAGAGHSMATENAAGVAAAIGRATAG